MKTNSPSRVLSTERQSRYFLLIKDLKSKSLTENQVQETRSRLHAMADETNQENRENPNQMDTTVSGGHSEPGRTAETLVPGEGLSCSCLTTKELQQNLRAVKQRHRTIKLLFDIPSSRIIEHVLSKHVVYQITVIRTGSYDSRRVSVERRYSNFVSLHQQLVKDFSEELEEITLPRKLLTGNFNPESISERRLALQDYLAKLYTVRCVRYSRRFQAFFTKGEQIRAHCLLRAGQFRAALVLLQTILDLQEKLAPWQSPALLVPTLCALAVCYCDLEEPREAFSIAQRALVPVRRYGLKRYRVPLLDLLVNLGYQLGCPMAQLQEELMLIRDKERGLVSFSSLKELVVQEFTLEMGCSDS